MELAGVDESKLCLPVTGDMFLPLSESHPQPFLQNLEWKYMKCPMCGYRPIEQEERVLTDKGFIEVGKKPVRKAIKKKAKPVSRVRMEIEKGKSNAARLNV